MNFLQKKPSEKIRQRLWRSKGRRNCEKSGLIYANQFIYPNIEITRLKQVKINISQQQNMTNLATKREQARLLYSQGLDVSQIAREIDTPRPTVASWKKRDGWVRADIFADVNMAFKARLLSLIGMEKKGNGEYKEIDEMMRQLERIAKINKYNETGNGGDLNPKLRERYKKDRKEKVSNPITEEEIQALSDAFDILLYQFQQDWVEILNGLKQNGKQKHAPARIFMLLKSRQIGATYIIAIWALINALKTKKNKIFLSASKAQAYQFIEYIKSFVFEVLGKQLKGDPITITFEDNTSVNLYYMGTNALTAQGRHGDVIMDEFFWIRKFKEFRDVASGMASQSHYQQIYLSTPSSVLHEAYQFWTGKDGVFQGEIDTSHAKLKTPILCADGKWRQIVTVKDAIKGGYDKLDIHQLEKEYTPDRFNNLFMCIFLDDSESYFPLSILTPNMIDSWEVWKDFKPMGAKPFNKPVWVGYDPSFTGDKPAIAVIAPPTRPNQPYRVLERKHLDHQPPHVQAQYIKKVCERYNVEFLGIDVTGAGIAVAEHVKAFYPFYTPINYSIEVKTRMALRVKELFYRRKLHFDAGYTDIAKAFIAIKNSVTKGGGKMTLIAKRSNETGHSDIAWAIMNALEHAPLASTEQPTQATKSKIAVHR